MRDEHLNVVTRWRKVKERILDRLENLHCVVLEIKTSIQQECGQIPDSIEIVLTDYVSGRTVLHICPTMGMVTTRTISQGCEQYLSRNRTISEHWYISLQEAYRIAEALDTVSGATLRPQLEATLLK